MSKFLALYLTPTSVLDNWMSTPEEERKTLEAKMKTEWDEWVEKNAAMVKETFGAGKVKRATPEGLSDGRNDVMMYSIVEAESHEEAAKIFENHPHLQIPEATIEIMAANPITSM